MATNRTFKMMMNQILSTVEMGADMHKVKNARLQNDEQFSSISLLDNLYQSPSLNLF